MFHNTNGLHKCIIDLSLNLTQEEFDTKETYTHKDILYIFKDISGNLLREFYNILDSDETYQKLDVSSFIEKIYYTITYKISENEYVLIDTSMNTKDGYILNKEMHGYILNNLDTWNEFKEFIKKFNIKHCLDFLGCALLQSSDWIYTLDMLETEQHLYLNIRASDDDTGNLKVGGDWVLESDNVNIKELYFNVESIEKWYSLLRSITNGYVNVNGTEVNVPDSDIKFSKLYDSFYSNPGANDIIKLSANLNETKLFNLDWTRPYLNPYPNDNFGSSLSIKEKFKGITFTSGQIPVAEGVYSPQAQTIPGFQGYNPGPINAWWRRLVLRVSYSGDFIRSFVSPGGTTGGKIRSISFNVTNPVKDSTSTTSYLPLPEYSVGIRNGTNIGSNNFNTEDEEWTIFREARKYSPVTAGLHTFYIDVTAGSTSFSWTGGTLNFVFVWAHPNFSGAAVNYRAYAKMGIVKSFQTVTAPMLGSASTYHAQSDNFGTYTFYSYANSLAPCTPVLTLEFTGDEPNSNENGNLGYGTGDWEPAPNTALGGGGNTDPKFSTHYRFRTYSSVLTNVDYLPNPFVYINKNLFYASYNVLPGTSDERTYTHTEGLAGILPTAKNSFFFNCSLLV